MSIQTELERIQSVLRPIGLYRFDDNSLLYAELRSYAVGLNILNSFLEQLEKEAFTATAEDFGLKLRESLCGRTLDGATLEHRRQILNYITSVTANDFNLQGIKKAVSTSGINADVAELFDSSTVYINCLSMLDPEVTQEQAEKLAKKFTPAHLSVIFDFRNINWDMIELKDLSFNDMDAKGMTWTEIDQYSD